MARPRRQTYTMKQYLDDNVKAGYIVNDVDTQRNPAYKPIIDGLVVTILTDEYIPPIILGEEDSGQMHIVDGGSRTTAFDIFRYGNYKVKSSVENPVIHYKKITKDENGKTMFEDSEFDIRNKTFEQLPKELQKKFDEYQIETVIHEHCDKEKIAMYMKRYNERKNFTASQKQFLYIPKFAEQIREITKCQFFVNNCVIKDTEKDNGILERIISESVMLMFHFDNWNKNGKKLSMHLNENSTENEFSKLKENIVRLENIVNDDTKVLFTSRDSFIWFALFDKFISSGLDDGKFGDFLQEFVNGFREKEVDGNTFDRVDDTGSTKDKKNISTKLHIIETLMREFLHIEETENVAPESFVAEMVDIPVEKVKEEMECYEETLDYLENNTIRDGSKLLDVENRLSLLAMVAYSYKNDVDLDNWIEEYAEKNDAYLFDQAQNYRNMKHEFEKWNKRKE